jgi:hypothetical protein
VTDNRARRGIGIERHDTQWCADARTRPRIPRS